MNELYIGLVVAIATAIVGYFIIKIRSDGRAETFYNTYQVFFALTGQIIKNFDEKLYDEMKEVSELLAIIYKNPEFTESDLKEVLKEAKDVYDRAKKLM